MTSDPSQELEALHRAGGAGSIGGVAFDFRHPKIQTDWEPIHPLGSSRGRGAMWIYGKHPRISFPWTKDISEYRKRQRSKLVGRAALRHLVKYGPDGRAAAGDRVFIASSTLVWVGSDFDTDQDAALYHVRYAVERADGRVDRVRSYSIYVHRDSHWAHRTTEQGVLGGLSLDVLQRRLEELLYDGDLDEHGSPADHCEINAANCADAIARAREFAANDDPKGLLKNYRENALIEAGFYLARAEAEVMMGAYAQRGMVNETARLNASASRSKAADPVREAARADLAENPKTSQSSCATRVALRLGSNQRSVERIIAPMFEWRELPGGRREKRAKAEFLP